MKLTVRVSSRLKVSMGNGYHSQYGVQVRWMS